MSKNIDVYLAFTKILKITPFWILTHTLASAVHPKIAVFSYKSIKMFAIGEIVVGKRTRKKNDVTFKFVIHKLYM